MNLNSIFHPLSPLALAFGVSFDGSKTQEACADKPCKQSSAQRLPLPHSPRHSPNAHKAAKNITVLYSQNDNILGPILAPEDEPPGTKLEQLYHRKTIDETIAGVFTTYLDLGSVYLSANALAEPLSELLNKDQIDWAWLSWVNKCKQSGNVAEGVALHHDLETQLRNTRNDTDLQHFCLELSKRIKKNRPHIDKLLADHQGETIKMGSIKTIYTLLENIEKIEHLFFYHGQDRDFTKGYYHYLHNFFIPETPKIEPRELFEAPRRMLYEFACNKLPHFEKLITFLYFATLKSPIKVTPAMGAIGARIEGDEMKKWIDNKFLKNVNTTKWVYAHSDMKIPSDDIMNHVYKGNIIGKKGITKFGTYTGLEAIT